MMRAGTWMPYRTASDQCTGVGRSIALTLLALVVAASWALPVGAALVWQRYEDPKQRFTIEYR